ncbi:MAG: restriction endonuclease subunit S [Bacteroidales bacterium]|nr:restriction endonuclease subunit S [Bacteroidales bacterium]
MNSTGTGTVGRTRLFKESCLGEYPFVLPDSHISVVRAAAGIIPQYLFAYITSNKIQYYIEDNLAGSTNQKELYIGVLEQMEIFVPPLPEQHRIAAEIEKWFALIDQIEQGKASLQTTIKQTKSKILDLAIHGRLVPQDPSDEPAAELLKRINPKAEIISQNTYFQSETYPDSWVLTTIESINSYKSHSVNPMITPEEEFDLYSVPIFPTQMPEHNKGKEIGSTKQLIQHGDILLCKINPHLNRVWEVSQQDNDTPKIASSEWIVIRSPHVCSSYLRYFFESESFRQLLCSQVSGVGGSLTRAQPAVVKKNYVPLPPLPEQHRIAAKIEELFSALDNIQKALEA